MKDMNHAHATVAYERWFGASERRGEEARRPTLRLDRSTVIADLHWIRDHS